MARGATLKRISKTEILHGMALCLTNARDLLKESETLLSNGGSSGAFVLGALALEEAAKVVFLTFAFHSSRHEMSNKALEKFWRGLGCCRFQRHRVRCIDGTGGGSWNDGSLRGSSSLRR